MSVTAAQTAENRAIVSDAVSEVVSEGNFDRVDELYGPDLVNHRGIGDELRGPAAFREWMAEVHAGFPDFEATEEFSLCEGDLVASRLTYAGTHDGEFMGIPATGEYVEVTGTTINRIEDGKIVESWPETDFLGVFQQVGVVESPAN
jgi:steroid delta-isomerase-like uncharacterized protein